ncbi:MAG: EamA family transporter [Bryobacteraceae bacterium]
MTWVPFALLSAVFAALTAILGKKGVENIDSNLAVAIRTSIVVVFAWGIVAAGSKAMALRSIPVSSWVFLALSGLATGLSWLFYFRALQIGPASRVAPVDKLSVAITIVLAFALLGERPSMGSVLGGLLIAAGVLVAALVR